MSFNSFSSLENINQFFNSLINSNKKNALPLKHISIDAIEFGITFHLMNFLIHSINGQKVLIIIML